MMLMRARLAHHNKDVRISVANLWAKVGVEVLIPKVPIVLRLWVSGLRERGVRMSWILAVPAERCSAVA